MEKEHVENVIELTPARRGMAKVMTYSWQTIPHSVQMASANAARLISVKEQLNGPGFNDILMKVVANAVSASPNMNSTAVDGKWVRHDRVDLTVAVMTEAGLMTPVLRDVAHKDIYTVSKEAKALFSRARSGMLTAADLEGGTLAVSNLGDTAVETGTPVIAPPQVALVFFGSICRRPIIDELGRIVPGYVLGYSVAFDHRYIEGITSSRFTTAIRDGLEQLTVEQLM